MPSPWIHPNLLIQTAGVFRHAFSRAPLAGERKVLSSVIGDGRDAQSIEDLLWLVFMQPEYQIVR